jgi:flagellar biosynthetic protein FlhB
MSGAVQIAKTALGAAAGEEFHLQRGGSLAPAVLQELNRQQDWKSAVSVLTTVALIAGADYGYQFWKHQKDMMMTKEEVKEESKSSEGNPLVKGELRKRRIAILRQNWIREIPKADVVVTNPTHLAVALRYDRKTMRAPRIVAKGARLNALRIREIAEQFQIPIVENKPVAQLLFKHCKVGQEVPPQVYTAVAEILAYVYRVNRFRYHLQGQQISA